mmetsp:Transcript_2592/g.10856  ORF Transcript_2592/g.10856 Transcript_2592/m.10856 type:complete len:402 (+) Transcript_2592:3029-4234(+)
MLPNNLVGEVNEVALVRHCSSLAVGHVQHVAADPLCFEERPHDARPRLHAAEPAVPDPQRDDLSARRNSIQERRIGMVRRSDGSDVGSVCSHVIHDAQSLAVVVEVEPVVQGRGALHASPLTVFVKVSHGLALTEVSALGRVDVAIPRGTLGVQEGDAIEHGSTVVVLVGEALQLLQLNLQVLQNACSRLRLLLLLGNCSSDGRHGTALLLVPGLSPLPLETALQSPWKDVVGVLDAESEFGGLTAAGRHPLGIEKELAAGQSGDKEVPVLVFLRRSPLAHVHVSRSRAVDDVQDLRLSIRGDLQSRRPRVDARVEDADDHSAAIVVGVSPEKCFGAGLLLRQARADGRRVRDAVTFHIAAQGDHAAETWRRGIHHRRRLALVGGIDLHLQRSRLPRGKRL